MLLQLQMSMLLQLHLSMKVQFSVINDAAFAIVNTVNSTVGDHLTVNCCYFTYGYGSIILVWTKNM